MFRINFRFVNCRLVCNFVSYFIMFRIFNFVRDKNRFMSKLNIVRPMSSHFFIIYLC